MESIDLNMDDIFEREDGDGNEDNFPSALPDLPEELAPLEDGDDNITPTQDAENAEVLAKLKGMKGAGKKVVRKPQPKLDGSRLTGERGIAILPRVFKDVKFKGRGHEAEDLRVTMKYLEHWAHRLFPMMPFDEVIERIEKLGTKKEVQTCIKKMRLDIPILNEDFVEEQEEDNPPTPPRGPGNRGDFDAEEAFDEMMREEQEQRLLSQKTPGSTQRDTPTTPVTPVKPVPTPMATPAALPNGLTPEQMEKIERNKRLAMEKRAARLAAQQTPGSATSTSNNSSTGSTETTDKIQNNRTSLSQAEISQPMDTTEPNMAAEEPTHPTSLQQDGDSKQMEATKEAETSQSSVPEAECFKMAAVDTAQSADQSPTSPSLHLYMSVDSTEQTESSDNAEAVGGLQTAGCEQLDNNEPSEIPKQTDTPDSHSDAVDRDGKAEGKDNASQKCESDRTVNKELEDESVTTMADEDKTLSVNRYTELETEDLTATPATVDNDISSSNDKTDAQTMSTEKLSSDSVDKVPDIPGSV